MRNRIKELRKRKKISQKELAKKINTTHQNISLYESNKREPKLETWQKLADFFQVSVPYLQGVSDFNNVLSDKGKCDFCNNDKPYHRIDKKFLPSVSAFGQDNFELGLDNYSNKPGDYSLLSSIWVNNYNLMMFSKINYCPFCGRKLGSNDSKDN